nr:BlaI/MecI/CopY family transcriptional regulator [candidate division Zixibacteria bacterium]
MKKSKSRLFDRLSMRERQIMDIIYRMEKATAAEIHRTLPDPPSYSAVRALLGILEEKGFVRHEKEGRQYIYHPTLNRDTAARSAMKHLVRTFYDGSVENAVASLVSLSATQLTDDELERLEQVIREARAKEG